MEKEKQSALEVLTRKSGYWVNYTAGGVEVARVWVQFYGASLESVREKGKVYIGGTKIVFLLSEEGVSSGGECVVGNDAMLLTAGHITVKMPTCSPAGVNLGGTLDIPKTSDTKAIDVFVQQVGKVMLDRVVQLLSDQSEVATIRDGVRCYMPHQLDATARFPEIVARVAEGVTSAQKSPWWA